MWQISLSRLLSLSLVFKVSVFSILYFICRRGAARNAFNARRSRTQPGRFAPASAAAMVRGEKDGLR